MNEWFSHLVVNPDIIYATKGMFLLTIPWGFWVWFRCYLMRGHHPRINNIFMVQCLVIPMYSLFTFMIVFGIVYPKPVGLFCWSVIDVLFLSTDMMMSAALVRSSKRLSHLNNQVNSLKQENDQLRAQLNHGSEHVHP